MLHLYGTRLYALTSLSVLLLKGATSATWRGHDSLVCLAGARNDSEAYGDKYHVPLVGRGERPPETSVTWGRCETVGWESSSLPADIGGYSPKWCMPKGNDEHTNEPPRQQAVRKRSLRRALRLICLRGHVWYKDRHYDTTNVTSLIALPDFRQEVIRLSKQDKSITRETLEKHGLWKLIPEREGGETFKRWVTSNVLVISSGSGQSFGFQVQDFYDPRDMDSDRKTYRVTGVIMDSGAAVSGLKIDDVILSINGQDVASVDMNEVEQVGSMDCFILREEIEDWSPSASTGVISAPDLEYGVNADNVTFERICRNLRKGKNNRGKMDLYMSFNVDTLDSVDPGEEGQPIPPGRLAEISSLAKSLGISVVALQGHRWKFSGTLQGRIQGFKVFVNGARRQGMPEGTILAFDESWDERGFQQPVNASQGRAQVVRYKSTKEGVDMSFINVLAPGARHSEAAKESFHGALMRVLRLLKARSVLVGFGDFNAHMAEDETPGVGPMGYSDEEDSNGIRLRQLCAELKVMILNRDGKKCQRNMKTSTFFGGKDPRGQQIDFAFLSIRAQCTITKSCMTDWNMPVRRPGKKEDHRPLVWGLTISSLLPADRHRKRKNKKMGNKRWDYKKMAKVLQQMKLSELDPKLGNEKVDEPPEAEELRKGVLTRLAVRSYEAIAKEEVDMRQRLMNDVLIDAGDEVGFTKKGEQPRRKFMQKDIWNVVQDKQQAVPTTMSLKTKYAAVLSVLEAWCEKNCDCARQRTLWFSWESAQITYAFEVWRSLRNEGVLEDESSRLLERDTIEATDKLTQRAEENALRNGWREVFQIVNTLAPKVRAPAVAVHNDEGDICLDDKDAFDAWSQHVITTFRAEIIEEEAPSPPPLGKKKFEWKSEYGSPQMPASLMLKSARIEVYIDGSFMKMGTGWGAVVILVAGDGAYYLWEMVAGPVITRPRHAEYEGAQVGSNNTAEVTAQLMAHRICRRTIPWCLPLMIRFDSLFANDVTAGVNPTKSNRMLAGKARGERGAHVATRTQLCAAHVRGHSDNPMNDLVDEVAKAGTTITETIYWRLDPKPYHTLFQIFPELKGRYERPDAKSAREEPVDNNEWEVSMKGIEDERMQDVSMEEELCFWDAEEKAEEGSEDDETPATPPLWCFSDEDVADGGAVSDEDGEDELCPEDFEFWDCIAPEDEVQSSAEWPKYDPAFITSSVYGPSRGKATGPGQPRIECFQIAFCVTFGHLLALFEGIEKVCKWPLDWKVGYLIYLRKGGGNKNDGTQRKHYRPICKLDHLGKGVFAQRARLIRRFVQRLCPISFFGYLVGRSTTMAVAVLEEVVRRFLTRARRSTSAFWRGVSLVVVFLDLTQAFGNVDREQMFRIMKEQLSELRGVQLEIEELMNATEYRLTGPEGAVRRFAIRRGVRQGSSEGPVLLLLVYMGVMMRVAEPREALDSWISLRVSEIPPEFLRSRTCNATELPYGTAVHDISDLCFADDTATIVLFRSLIDISLVLGIFHDVLQAFGLEVNWAKTEIMIFWSARCLAKKWRKLKGIRVLLPGHDYTKLGSEHVAVTNMEAQRADPVFVGGDDEMEMKQQDSDITSKTKARDKRRQGRKKQQQGDERQNGTALPVVAVVTVFTYLGSCFTQYWNATAEVRTRLSAAGGAFARLRRRVWGSAILPVPLKLRL